MLFYIFYYIYLHIYKQFFLDLILLIGGHTGGTLVSVRTSLESEKIFVHPSCDIWDQDKIHVNKQSQPLVHLSISISAISSVIQCLLFVYIKYIYKYYVYIYNYNIYIYLHIYSGL